MALVTFEDINARLTALGTPLAPEQAEGVGVLIDDAEAIIEAEFARVGRNWPAEVTSKSWLGSVSERVIREMVSAALAVGPNAGVRTASSTTGPQSDSVTWADVDSVSFGGVKLTDKQRADLGLPTGAYARGRFPRPIRVPEVKFRG